MSQVIVLTGASEGIGAALAKRLGARGDRLVLAARRASKLDEVAAEIAAPGHVLTLVTDVTKREDHERLRDAAIERFDHIDVWINNAGRGVGIKTLELTEADFDHIITVNLKSAWYGMQTIIPYFQQRGEGHLINVSSVLGRVPTATPRSIYSASKAALNSLTANVRMDLRAEYPNIKVSLVMPGPVATGFHANALGKATPFTGNNVSIQQVEEVARALESVIDQPVPELYTNPASASLVERYFSDVGAFEDAMFGTRKPQVQSNK